MQVPTFGDPIMRSCVAAFFLTPLLAGPALAGPVPFEGRWGWTADACDLAPGESDMVPIEIGDGAIDYYESACTIDRVEPVGAGDGAAWTVTTSCSGEGETWTTRSIFAIDDRGDDSRRQLIEIDLESGFVIVRQECGATQ